MSNKTNDFYVAVFFSIIWIMKPISYDDLRSRHPISLQEDSVVVSRPSISIKNEEFDFFKSEIPFSVTQLESGISKRVAFKQLSDKQLSQNTLDYFL